MNDTLDQSLSRSTPSTLGVDCSPTLQAQLVASAYRRSSAGARALILEHLLRPVGPLAIVALAAGAFGAFLYRGDYRRLVILPDDVAKISIEQLIELMHYVEQRSPETLQGVAQLLEESATGLVGIGGSLLAAADDRAGLAQPRPGQTRRYPWPRVIQQKRNPAATSAKSEVAPIV